MWKVSANILRLSCPCCVSTAKCCRKWFNELEEWASTQNWPFHPFLCELVFCWPVNKMYIYIIRQIISSYIIHGTITFYTIQPVLADWPFVRQWIESLCGIVSVGLDSAVAELSSPQVNRFSQHWIENCVQRNWIEFRSIALNLKLCSAQLKCSIDLNCPVAGRLIVTNRLI